MAADTETVGPPPRGGGIGVRWGPVFSQTGPRDLERHVAGVEGIKTDAEGRILPVGYRLAYLHALH